MTPDDPAADRYELREGALWALVNSGDDEFTAAGLHWRCLGPIVTLLQERDRLQQENQQLASHGLELAARVSFLVEVDTPDTNRRARANLLTRLQLLEAERDRLRGALQAVVELGEQERAEGRDVMWTIDGHQVFHLCCEVLAALPPTSA